MEYRDPFATQAASQAQATSYDAGLRAYMLRIYNYMASALALTGIVAYATASNPALLSVFYNVQPNGHPTPTLLGILLFFVPFGLVIWLGRGLQSMSPGKVQGIFWAYAALMGIWLTPMVLVYTGASIAQAFFVTAGTFGAMSLYGYTTKKDLTGMGHFLMMGLFGVIIAMIVNFFLRSPALYFALSIMTVFIFVGLTAYDTQRIKAMYYQVSGSDMIAKVSIMAALTLYMDFINIFIYLVTIMNQRR